MISQDALQVPHSEHPTSENAVMALRLPIEKFGAPASVFSDNGSCFVGQNGSDYSSNGIPEDRSDNGSCFVGQSGRKKKG